MMLGFEWGSHLLSTELEEAEEAEEPGPLPEGAFFRPAPLPPSPPFAKIGGPALGNELLVDAQGRSWSFCSTTDDTVRSDRPAPSNMSELSASGCGPSDSEELAAAIGRGLPELHAEAEVRARECEARRSEIREGLEQIQHVLGETERDFEPVEEECRRAEEMSSRSQGENGVRALGAYRGRMNWATTMADGLRAGIDNVAEWDIPDSQDVYKWLAGALDDCLARIARLEERMSAAEQWARRAIAAPQEGDAVPGHRCFWGHTLQRCIVQDETTACEECNGQVSQGTLLAGCPKCEVYFCQSCEGSAVARPWREALQGMTLGGHVLEWS